MSDVALTPPGPIATRVLAHRKRLEVERDALRVGNDALALKAVMGDEAARAALRAVPSMIAGLTHEIDQNHAAYSLAVQHDQDAMDIWRREVQTLHPEDLIEGIGKDSCCTACQHGAFCAITAGYAYAGAQCGHPVKERDTVFIHDANGQRRFLYGHNPQAAKVFAAACKKLKVRI